MGIRTSFTGNAQAIDISKIADDLLADVIADHAADRFRAANRANRQVAGAEIAYSVSVDGRTVHHGRGELFPANQVALVVRQTPGRRHNVIVDWLWDRLQAASLRRVIAAYGEIESLARFARILADPQMALFRFVLTSYLRYRFPTAMARLSQAKDTIRDLRRLYRLYRVAGIAGGESRDADADVLAWIARELRDRSPVLTGAYRDAHALYADGRFVMTADAVNGNGALPDAEEFAFTNTVPYARKIELGMTRSGRPFVMQVPNFIYERVAEDARNSFKGVADISFEMRAADAATQTPQRSARARHNRPEMRFPAIVVRF